MKIKEIIQEYFKNKTFIKGTTLNKFLKKNIYIHKILKRFLNIHPEFETVNNIILSIIKNIPIKYCEICKKPIKFSKRTQKFCCKKCMNLDKEHYIKAGITKEERYNNKNYNNIKKAKKTCLKKFGVSNPAKNISIQNKIKSTCLKKYSVEYSVQSEQVKEKSKLTKFQKYHNEKFTNIEKAKETIFKKSYNKYLNLLNVEPAFSLKEYQGKIGYDKKYLWKCKYCGNIFESSCFNQIPICRKCFPILTNRSKLEEDVVNVLKKFNVSYIQHNKSIIKPYELDIVIPDKKIAIEINGTYWHSSEYKDKFFHLNKSLKCKKAGYKLLHIFEYEWKEHQDRLINILKFLLNINLVNLDLTKCELKLEGNILNVFYSNSLVKTINLEFKDNNLYISFFQNSYLLDLIQLKTNLKEHFNFNQAYLVLERKYGIFSNLDNTEINNVEVKVRNRVYKIFECGKEFLRIF